MYFGIYDIQKMIFWRKSKASYDNMHEGTLPKMYSDETTQKELMSNTKVPSDISKMFGYVDSDWTGDKRHRKSITGMAIMFAGATIAYKSRIQ